MTLNLITGQVWEQFDGKGQRLLLLEYSAIFAFLFLVMII